jgi:hypothetical protein
VSFPGWIFSFLRSSSTPCQQLPDSIILFSLKKYGKSTPAADNFVALPRRHQPLPAIAAAPKHFTRVLNCPPPLVPQSIVVHRH